MADIPEADLEIHVENCGGEVEGELSQAERGSAIPVPAKKWQKNSILVGLYIFLFLKVHKNEKFFGFDFEFLLFHC